MEVWCEDFAPETFWHQTPRTFAAALRGKVKSRRYEQERDLELAYNAGLFSAIAQSGKLKSLSHYKAQAFGRGDPTRGGSALLGAFQAMRARGLPVSIKKLN